MNPLNQHIDFFLERAEIQNNKLQISNKLIAFFSEENSRKHVILKRGILYFYQGAHIIDSMPCHYHNDSELIHSFDGEKVSRIQPEYYLAAGAAAILATEASAANNNNNNNNNNNGNNNG